jgi:hypothetical protein
MNTLTIADLMKDAEREFRAAFSDELVVQSCETFGGRICSAGAGLESVSRSDRDRTDIFLELVNGEVGDEEIQKALRA